MGTRINVADALTRLAGLPATVEVEGKTIRECLDNLVLAFPSSKKWLFDNKRRPLVLIFLNQGTNYITNLQQELKQGDVLNISIIAGGG